MIVMPIELCDEGVVGGALANQFLVTSNACVIRNLLVQLEESLPAGKYYIQLVAPTDVGGIPADGSVTHLAEPLKRVTTGAFDVIPLDFALGRGCATTLNTTTHVGPGLCVVLSSTRYTKTVVAGGPYMAIDASIRR